MKRVEKFYETLHKRYITQEYDRMIPVVADEGDGKSTFILESIIIWHRITGREFDPHDVLGRFSYEQGDFKDAIVDSEPRSIIAVPDAARVMHKKQAMHGSQIDLEKDLFDARIGEHVYLLGYQDWGTVPTVLQERRAKNCFVIPHRGRVHGYSRASMDERVESGEWPDPDIVDSFPSLEGTDIWRRYQKLDREKKMARMGTDDEDGGPSPQEVFADIAEHDVAQYVKENPVNGNVSVNTDLLRFDYPDLSIRNAKQVKAALEREYGIEQLFQQKQVAHEGTHTP